MANHYRTSHLFVPFGDDFSYSNAHVNFMQIDQLIAYMNENYDDMELFYSTPYHYIDAIYDEDIEWPTNYNDMLPYADGPHQYWTGYYTSRANFKGYVRDASSELNSHSM